jgi:hypothetical protein
MSPIEAVLEHLNQPISSNSEDSVRSDELSPRTRIAAGTASPQAQLDGHNPNSNYSDRGPLRVVAAPSSPASGGQQSVQSQPGAIRIVAPSATRFNKNPISAQMLTDTTGANFDDWLVRWSHETGIAWRSIISKDIGSRQPGPIVIRMKISPSGHIVDGSMVLEKRSGDAILDGDAWKALVASKYPQLPSDFHAPYLELRVTFSPN